MKNQEPLKKPSLPSDLKLYKLTLEQIRRIDEMLDDLGEYGEVHIVVQNGQLRYINKVESYQLWNREDKE